MSKEKAIGLLQSVSLIVILIMAALPLVHIKWEFAPYLFAIGAAGVLVSRLFETYSGDSLRIKRLYRMGKISAACYVVAAFFMFYEPSQPQDWLAFLTAGAVLHVYSSFVLVNEEKKEAAKKGSGEK